MLRSLVWLCPLVISSAAFAQSDAHALARPITTPVRDAGTFHVATGTWTRNGSAQAQVVGPEIVYRNTCPSGYFAALIQGEVYTDEGEIPDPGRADTPSTLKPGGFDTSPGCEYAYDINGFGIAYCTATTNFAIEIRFYDAYQTSGTSCAVPGVPTAVFPLNNLPSTATTAVQECWIVAIDLTGTTPAASFTLSGTGTQPKSFGWSFAMTSTPVSALTDGPLMAGRFEQCTGTDGTRWDHGTASVAWPNNFLEDGTGMKTQDAFRVDGMTSAPFGPGCYYFGGNPLASFHLELYSNVACNSSAVGVQYCTPNQDMVIACPCGNNPAGPNRGCNNSTQTGGARLFATSSNGASIANDQVVLTATNEVPIRTSLFIQGNSNAAAGVLSGDGVRCAGGQILRLNPLSGSLSNGQGTIALPNASLPQGIVAQSAALGQPIQAGDTRYYQALYRDSNLGFCPDPPGNAWNASAAVMLTWGP